MRPIISVILIVNLLDQASAFVPYLPDSSSDVEPFHDLEPLAGSVRRHDLGNPPKTRKLRGRWSRNGSDGKGRASDNAVPVLRRQENPEEPITIGLTSDVNDWSYWVDLKFGNSDKEFKVVVDTGSADTWIMSSDCTSDGCANHQKLGPTDSETLSTNSEKSFALQYATGNVSGSVATDSISLGPISLEEVQFGLSDIVSNDFSNFAIDGIMGLGFRSRSKQNVPTFLDNLISQKYVTNRIIGVHFHHSKDNLGNGAITFGGIDTRRIEGGAEGLKYYEKTIEDRWAIHIDDVIMDGQKVGFEGGRDVIIDTGSALITIPPADALKLHQNIPGTRSNGFHFQFPCDTTVSIEFQFGEDIYELPPRDYIGGVSDVAQNMCTGNIVAANVSVPGAWLFGAAFLRNVYSVYDMEESKIGFGKPIAPTASETSTLQPPPTRTPSSSRSTTSSQTPNPPKQPTSTSSHTSTLTASASPSPTKTSSAEDVETSDPTITNLPETLNSTTAAPPTETTSKISASSSTAFSNVLRSMLLPLILLECVVFFA